jgi:hypothetical protein
MDSKAVRLFPTRIDDTQVSGCDVGWCICSAADAFEVDCGIIKDESLIKWIRSDMI